MFTVAPNGGVKLAVFFDTPALSCTQRIVTGKVADEEEVENAVSSAVRIAFMCAKGRTFPNYFPPLLKAT